MNSIKRWAITAPLAEVQKTAKLLIVTLVMLLYYFVIIVSQPGALMDFELHFWMFMLLIIFFLYLKVIIKKACQIQPSKSQA